MEILIHYGAEFGVLVVAAIASDHVGRKLHGHVKKKIIRRRKKKAAVHK